MESGVGQNFLLGSDSPFLLSQGPFPGFLILPSNFMINNPESYYENPLSPRLCTAFLFIPWTLPSESSLCYDSTLTLFAKGILLSSLLQLKSKYEMYINVFLPQLLSVLQRLEFIWSILLLVYNQPIFSF